MKTDNVLQELIETLKRKAFENKANIWKRIAEDLEGSTRNRKAVNLYTISQVLRDGEIALVAGKVLGDGEVGKVTVAAYSFSESARSKILKTGKIMTINELLEKHPKGEKVRIIG